MQTVLKLQLDFNCDHSELSNREKLGQYTVLSDITHGQQFTDMSDKENPEYASPTRQDQDLELVAIYEPIPKKSRGRPPRDKAIPDDSKGTRDNHAVAGRANNEGNQEIAEKTGQTSIKDKLQVPYYRTQIHKALYYPSAIKLWNKVLLKSTTLSLEQFKLFLSKLSLKP